MAEPSISAASRDMLWERTRYLVDKELAIIDKSFVYFFAANVCHIDNMSAIIVKTKPNMLTCWAAGQHATPDPAKPGGNGTATIGRKPNKN